MPNPINLGLERIQDVSFFYQEPKQDISVSGINLDFSITNRFDIWPSENTVIITVEVSMGLDSEDGQAVPENRLLHYETIFFFKVNGIDFTPEANSKTGEEVVTLPIPISAALAGAAYSTCRGILYARTAGSQLGNYLMPMANTLKLIEGMGDKFHRTKAEQQTDAMPTFGMTRDDSQGTSALEISGKKKASKASKKKD